MVTDSMKKQKGGVKIGDRTKSTDGMTKGQRFLEKDKPRGRSFVKGNSWWSLRSKHGRDKLFVTPDLLWEAACEYFQFIEDNPLPEQQAFAYQGDVSVVNVDKKRVMTLTGLCLYLGCSEAYFRAFKSTIKPKDNEFLTVIAAIEQTIYNQKFEGAASGFFNANIISRDIGLSEKSEVILNPSEVAKLFPFGE